ncbi:hypothetical protein [Alphaentomopoxvirus acuprea]|uniref:Uncharacterized protein n=1 Tax=Alphaentomopoxvirus acuprea TaxID=62099 RepID=W6JIP0_9POXV|nr:hypothetical protein BA82_gp083 [Anomala cuprea entomopoxvirus]BAO49443.1 hypothetical protein [Anomala cuprea entomopoxvirus]
MALCPNAKPFIPNKDSIYSIIINGIKNNIQFEHTVNEIIKINPLLTNKDIVNIYTNIQCEIECMAQPSQTRDINYILLHIEDEISKQALNDLGKEYNYNDDYINFIDSIR